MLRLTIVLLLFTEILYAQTLTRVEYFFDTDPGFGNGLEISITSAPNLTQAFTIPLGTVSDGFHSLYIRAKDNNGLWSLPVIHPVFVQQSAQSASVTALTRIEYFFNTDPGIGNGIEIPITSAINITRDFTIPLGTIPEGFNSLYIRAKNSNGLWSTPVIHPVFVQRNAQSAATPNLRKLEYFIDTDPGLGNGTAVSLSSSNIAESLLINLTSVTDGFHILYLRTLDVNGRWSLPVARPFYSAIGGSEIVAVEYFYKDIATQTPSELRTVSNFPPAANLTLDFNAALDGLLPGTDYEIRVTAIDDANKRSKQAVHAFSTPTIICDPIPSPSVTDFSICGSGSVNLVATGATGTQTYVWYQTLTGGVALVGGTNGTYSTPALNDTTTYYVAIQNGTCESTRIPVTAFINPIPSAPTTSDSSACGNATVTLSASGGANGQYRWYTVATGGTPIAGEVNSSYITPVLTTTTSYFVAINDGSCESLRTVVVATINTPPAIPTITSSVAAVGNALTICSTTSLTLTAPAGFAAYNWSTGETTQQISVSASGNYSLAVTDAVGCVSPSSVAFVVTLLPPPCNNQPPVISTINTSTVIGGLATINLLDLISDADDNLVPSSLAVIQQPTSGASAVILNGILEIDYLGISFSGLDQITIQVCDVFGACTQQVLEIDVIGDIEIYNGISPNGDEQNEIFLIRYIDLLPETQKNKVTIFNRWGSKVFEVDDYNNSTKVFRGLNDSGNELPSGTYFYKIEFTSGRKSETGYLSLKR